MPWEKYGRFKAIFLIFQVRAGKLSRDFEKWIEESKCFDSTKCFVVFYGSEFKLRSLSVVGMDS